MSWLQTSTGGVFDVLTSGPEHVRLDDIAHALSNLCRFGGHCRRFYSVAEHSVHVSHLVPPAYALEGLLHDASEAYCVDLPRPIKQILPGYRALEGRIGRVVRQAFGLPLFESLPVKAADNAMLLAERDALLPLSPLPWTWAEGLAPADRVPMCLTPEGAKAAFLTRYLELRRDASGLHLGDGDRGSQRPTQEPGA
jgi:5'-deoxynucleotidase YfbR-like HD superfamily hydrolase